MDDDDGNNDHEVDASNADTFGDGLMGAEWRQDGHAQAAFVRQHEAFRRARTPPAPLSSPKLPLPRGVEPPPGLDLPPSWPSGVEATPRVSSVTHPHAASTSSRGLLDGCSTQPTLQELTHLPPQPLFSGQMRSPLGPPWSTSPVVPGLGEVLGDPMALHTAMMTHLGQVDSAAWSRLEAISSPGILGGAGALPPPLACSELGGGIFSGGWPPGVLPPAFLGADMGSMGLGGLAGLRGGLSSQLAPLAAIGYPPLIPPSPPGLNVRLLQPATLGTPEYSRGSSGSCPPPGFEGLGLESSHLLSSNCLGSEQPQPPRAAKVISLEDLERSLQRTAVESVSPSPCVSRPPGIPSSNVSSEPGGLPRMLQELVGGVPRPANFASLQPMPVPQLSGMNLAMAAVHQHQLSNMALVHSAAHQAQMDAAIMLRLQGLTPQSSLLPPHQQSQQQRFNTEGCPSLAYVSFQPPAPAPPPPAAPAPSQIVPFTKAHRALLLTATNVDPMGTTAMLVRLLAGPFMREPALLPHNPGIMSTSDKSLVGQIQGRQMNMLLENSASAELFRTRGGLRPVANMHARSGSSGAINVPLLELLDRVEKELNLRKNVDDGDGCSSASGASSIVAFSAGTIAAAVAPGGAAVEGDEDIRDGFNGRKLKVELEKAFGILVEHDLLRSRHVLLKDYAVGGNMVAPDSVDPKLANSSDACLRKLSDMLFGSTSTGASVGIMKEESPLEFLPPVLPVSLLVTLPKGRSFLARLLMGLTTATQLPGSASGAVTASALRLVARLVLALLRQPLEEICQLLDLPTRRIATAAAESGCCEDTERWDALRSALLQSLVVWSMAIVKGSQTDALRDDSDGKAVASPKSCPAALVKVILELSTAPGFVAVLCRTHRGLTLLRCLVVIGCSTCGSSEEWAPNANDNDALVQAAIASLVDEVSDAIILINSQQVSSTISETAVGDATPADAWALVLALAERADMHNRGRLMKVCKKLVVATRQLQIG